MSKFLVLTIFMMSTVYADCRLEEKNFSSSGGTEFLFTLVLSSNGDAQLQHEYWAPGEAKDPRIDFYEGKWNCQLNKIDLIIRGVKESGVYKAIGENPIGINPRSKVLVMEPSSGILSERILYEFDI